MPGKHSSPRLWAFLLALIILSGGLSGCSGAVRDALGVVTAKDLARSYKGVLQAVHMATGPTEMVGTGLLDTSSGVIIDIDLLHEITATETGTFEVTFESPLVERFKALIVGAADAAVGLDFVSFDGFDVFDPASKVTGMTVKQIVFTKKEGEWVFVLQMFKLGLEGSASTANVYQYVAYPPSVAEAMSHDDAILYVNTVLRLASAAQRTLRPLP